MNVHGVDFSGAAEPGCKIWITSVAVREDGTLSPTGVRSAAAEFRVTRREPLLEALREFLAGTGGAVGLDLSFGLPRAVLAKAGAPHDGWMDFLVWFRERFEDADAPGMQETLREWGRSSGVEGVEHKRRTDAECAANSPYSNITRYQTLHGIRDVLAPLVAECAVSVQPMAPVDGVRPLLEVYPAATLRDAGTHDRRYKENNEASRERREEILERLYEGNVERLDERTEQVVLANSGGDALDSLVAAVATARAVGSGFAVEEERYDPVEGHIYV